MYDEFGVKRQKELYNSESRQNVTVSQRPHNDGGGQDSEDETYAGGLATSTSVFRHWPVVASHSRLRCRMQKGQG